LVGPKRRLTQNRAAQKAFRQRKEKYVKDLEHQLEDLHLKHQNLLQSYVRQVDQVSHLNARVQTLKLENESLRLHFFNGIPTPDRFDANPSRGFEYPGAEFYFDKNMMSGFALTRSPDTIL
jgi:AP-1-like transcription factor